MRGLAELAVPELADRIAIELLDQVVRGEDVGRDQPGFARLRRVILRDVQPGASVMYREGDEILAPLTHGRVAVLFRGEPVVAPSLAEAASEVTYTPQHADVLLGRGVHTLMVVPLIARGTTLGVAAFGRAEQRDPYDDADLRLVSDLASRAALHIDNARLYAREHDTAVTLQRSLLPQAIPEVAGLRLAYGYQADRSAEAGGDWFDVLPLHDGQVALVIGDVTGHGIHAAAIMGQLRTATVTLTRLGRPPDEIMRGSAACWPTTTRRSGPRACMPVTTQGPGAAASPVPVTRHPWSVIPTAGWSSSMCSRG